MMTKYIPTAEDRAKGIAARVTQRSPVELISKARLDVSAETEAKIKSRLLEMPQRCRRGYLRAMGGKSITAAVKAQCLECVGWIREEVRLCTAPACPLYPYRPFQET